MAKKAVTERGVCIRVACQAFGISESCYRYERKLDAENAEVANWLMKLTDNHRSWGFGLCYLYLRNVKGNKIESQACVPRLQGAGAQSTDQAAQAIGAREARGADGA
jgi:putative transposase